MEIRIDVDVTKGLKLCDTLAKQVPYAMARTLTRLAQEIKAAEVGAMKGSLDAPTPFTLSGVYIQPAKKDKLVAKVWLKEDAAKGTPAVKYLEPQVKGGSRRLKRSERALALKGLIPDGTYLAFGKGAKLNQYGNLPNGTIQKILSQAGAAETVGGYMANETEQSKKRKKSSAARYFVGKPAGGRLPLGVYQRMKSGIKPILIAISKPNYKAKFHFFTVANTIYARRFRKYFREYLAEAIRTARR